MEFPGRGRKRAYILFRFRVSGFWGSDRAVLRGLRVVLQGSELKSFRRLRACGNPAYVSIGLVELALFWGGGAYCGFESLGFKDLRFRILGYGDSRFRMQGCAEQRCPSRHPKLGFGV